MVTDLSTVRHRRAARHERVATQVATPSMTPARLLTMVVQGRYKEATAVFVAQRATLGVVTRAPMLDDASLAARTLRQTNKATVDEVPNVWFEKNRDQLQAILQAFATQGGVSSDEVTAAISDMRRGRGGARGGMKQEHIYNFTAGCATTTKLLARWVTCCSNPGCPWYAHVNS